MIRWRLVWIDQLIDDAKCYEVVRGLRRPEGVYCPNCGSDKIKKRGHHDRYSYRQRYVCRACQQQFDDLSGTIFEGHHRPLRVWVLCLYFMGLNLSNKQIAEELDLPENEVQTMTTQLREGVPVKKACYAEWRGRDRRSVHHRWV